MVLTRHDPLQIRGGTAPARHAARSNDVITPTFLLLKTPPLKGMVVAIFTSRVARKQNQDLVYHKSWRGLVVRRHCRSSLEVRAVGQRGLGHRQRICELSRAGPRFDSELRGGRSVAMAIAAASSGNTECVRWVEAARLDAAPAQLRATANIGTVVRLDRGPS